MPALSSAFSPGRSASVEGLSLGSVASASAEARAGSANPGRKKTRGLRESVTTVSGNCSGEPEGPGRGAGEEEEVVAIVVVVDRRPSTKETAETRTRSTASLSEALLLLLPLLLLLLPRFLFEEIEGDGRPSPLVSQKNAIENRLFVVSINRV